MTTLAPPNAHLPLYEADHGVRCTLPQVGFTERPDTFNRHGYVQRLDDHYLDLLEPPPRERTFRQGVVEVFAWVGAFVVFGVVIAVVSGCGDERNPYGYGESTVSLADGKWHEQQTRGNAAGECITEWARFAMVPPPRGLEEMESMEIPCGEHPDTATHEQIISYRLNLAYDPASKADAL